MAYLRSQSLNICLVTGSAGLIGAEAIRFFSSKGQTGTRQHPLVGPCEHVLGVLQGPKAR